MTTLVRSIVPVVLTLAAGSALAQDAALRAAAEWEPAIGAQVRYPFGVPTSVLAEITRDDLLFVYVTQSQQANAQGNLSGGGANMANVRWIIQATDNIWSRDWGPSAVYTAAGDYRIADHRFTGYSTSGFNCALSWMDTSGWNNDDVAPAALASALQVPLVQVPAFLVGGNFLIDGTGRAFSTCLVYEENAARGISNAQVQAAMRDVLGITQHIVLPAFEASGIQHIDCGIKPVDTETILVKRPPAGHPSVARMNEIAAILAATPAPSGRPYGVRRIDTPYYSGQAITNYTNSLILNRKVLMPAWSIAGDAAAAQTFRDAMPGYTVVSFPWPQGWFSNDALHCRVRAVWDPGMLRVAHTRLAPQQPASPGGFAIAATVRAFSGASLVPGSPRVVWRTAGPGAPGPWIDLPMGAQPQSFQYAAAIPSQPAGTRIEYYLAAADQTGRGETLPRTAPAWVYSFEVVPGACYANCDGSTGNPALTPADFLCFLNRYRAGDAYANCDGSTGTPALTPADFACFLAAYRAGC